MSPRHSLAGRTIARMNGAGNAILVLDLRGSPVRATPQDARAIHRAPGLSYDQMMVLRNPKTAGTAVDVLIYNNDGTLAGACGNGTRCVGWLLMQASGKDHAVMESRAGLLVASRAGERLVSVDMGKPGLDWAKIPLAREQDTRALDMKLSDDPALSTPPGAVSMGNPHVVFVVADIEAAPVAVAVAVAVAAGAAGQTVRPVWSTSPIAGYSAPGWRATPASAASARA